jgi:glycerol kinase
LRLTQNTSTTLTMDGSKDMPIVQGNSQQQPDPALEKVSAPVDAKPKVRTESKSGATRPPLNRFTTSHENVLQENFIGAIDQGTTSSRFIIFDGVGEPVAMHQIEFEQKYPESG